VNPVYTLEVEMALPRNATPEELKSLVRYLGPKPSGATLKEAKAVLGSTLTDPRKLATAEALNIIVREGDRWKLTPDVGRFLVRADDGQFAKSLAAQLRRIPAYIGCLEWAFHHNMQTLTSSDVGANWHDHHRQELGTDNEAEIAQRAGCFLQLASGAALGEFVIGRRGQPSRLQINREKLEQFVVGNGEDHVCRMETPTSPEPEVHVSQSPSASPNRLLSQIAPNRESSQRNRRVFLTHGKNKAFLSTLKELLAFGEFEAVVAAERESVSQPVPDKVMEDMRKCGAAIIHVEAEKELRDKDGASEVVLNPNVLIEIGAAMALYGRRFILLVREGVKLPSNLQGLYEVRYQADKLDSEATIKLLKAINDIKNHPLPTLS
jgi:predicted nucleotide-binding protein